MFSFLRGLNKNIVFKCTQTMGYSGYKKARMTVYNGEDGTCYKNAKILKDKYGEETIGAKIELVRVHYSDSLNGNYYLSVNIDGLKVGVIFDSCEDYARFMKKKVKKAYCIIDNELSNDKGKIVSNSRARLMIKY